MKCAVAIVLALISMVVANPIAPLGNVAIASPVLLPSAVSVSSSVVNHGVTMPRVVYPIAPIIHAPLIHAPLIHAPLLKTHVSAWPAWSGYGYGHLAWGKGWH